MSDASAYGPTKRKLSRKWLGLLVIAAASGCGPRSMPVEGRVTLDGSPLPDARISFVMKDQDPYVMGRGVTDASGHYTIHETTYKAGLPEGAYQIRISTYREPRPSADPPDPGARELVPDCYNLRTTLTADITRGENELDFELQTRPGGGER